MQTVFPTQVPLDLLQLEAAQDFEKFSFANCSQALAGLPTFWPITFHLLESYSLIAANSAALCLIMSAYVGMEMYSL